MQSRTVGQAYAAIADRYIELFASGTHEHPDDIDVIRRHLGRRSGLLVDLGCGAGHLTGLLGADGARVMGFDIVPEFLQHAQSANPGLELHRGSIMDLPLPDASVSGALCWYSLIHLEPDAVDEALGEIRRVVQPGGSVVIGFFTGDDVEPFDHQVTTAYRWPMDELVRRLTDAGFDETERMQRGLQGARRPHGVVAGRRQNDSHLT